MGEKFLDKVYDLSGIGRTRDPYDAWAGGYDAEPDETNYPTPGRCAAALARFTTDYSAPILDFGCGTGICGTALAQAGFRTIDGADLSADLLKAAEARRVYRSLKQIDGQEGPVARRGEYSAIAAIGVIGTPAAPRTTFDRLMKSLAPGGRLVLSLNDLALQDPAHEGRISEWIDCGGGRLLFKRHGDHLPGIGMKSTVYVIERT